MTLQALQKNIKQKKTKTKNKKTIQSKYIHNFQKSLSYCSRQHSISHRPNLGIHYPPGSSSSNPLSRNLRPTSVERRH
jgi:hypothetical protein